MTSNNYFTFDKCYSKPTALSDASFNRILANDFYHSTVSSVRDCEIQSIRTNSEFFLINDISSTLNNNIYTNCYIPKVNNNNNNTNRSIFGDDTIIQRALQLFDRLFNDGSIDNPYSTQPMPIADSCNNLLFNLNRAIDQQRCFKYVIDEQIYTPKSKYAYYRRPLLTRDNINIMKNMRDPTTYTAPATLAQLTQFEELLKFDTTDPTYTSTNSDHGALTLRFKNYICSPENLENLTLLNVEITALNTNYNNLFTKLNEIKTDLSSINYINSFDNNTLRAINLNIITKSKELNNLLTSGGANNGRLDDSTLLTQFKIIENIILVLLIIYFIFYFTKKKAT
jgi:hypothetical protein